MSQIVCAFPILDMYLPRYIHKLSASRQWFTNHCGQGPDSLAHMYMLKAGLEQTSSATYFDNYKGPSVRGEQGPGSIFGRIGLLPILL